MPRAAPPRPASYNAISLELLLLKQHMLPDDWIVLHKLQLPWGVARVLHTAMPHRAGQDNKTASAAPDQA
eukprot:72859-Chlamydomonas_euryale.AAC.9